MKVIVESDNPYFNGTLYTDSDGNNIYFSRSANFLIENCEVTENEEYHPVTASDTLRGLALHYYNDKIQDAQNWWHIIADLNSIPNPKDLTEWVGKRLLIPDIDRVLLL